MKNRLTIIFVLNLLMIAGAQALEGGIATKSRALFEVISAVEAARYDLPVSYELYQDNTGNSEEKCSVVDAQEVVLAFEDMVSAYRVVFPDDELPYEQAIADFAALVGSSEYSHCRFERDLGRETVVVESFKSLSTSFKVTFLHHQIQ